MSNHDLTIANGPGINVRQDLEAALQALGTNFQGSAAPLTAYPCQIWADSSASLLKIRNVANTAWITIGPLDTANFGHLPLSGGTVTGNLTVNGTTNVNALNSATHGVTGNLNVSGAGGFGGSVTGNFFQVNTTSAASASIQLNVAGVRNYQLFTNTDGTFYIWDISANASRINVSTAGLVTINQQLQVNSNLTVLGTAQAAGCTVTVANGNYAVYYCTVQGTRTWYMGSTDVGAFAIADVSAGVARLTIGTGGVVTIAQNLTVNGASSTFNGSLSCGPIAAISAGNGIQRALQFQTNGSLRFHMMTDQTAEGAGNAGSNFALFAYDNTATSLGSVFSIVRATRIVTFSQPIVNGSDRRLKSDVEPVAGALAIIEKLEGVYYHQNDDATGKRHVGLIAQDVMPWLPEVVFESAPPMPEADPRAEGDSEPILGLAYPNIIAVLVNALKELSVKVATLEGAARR